MTPYHVYELPFDRFAVTAPLFSAAWFDEPYIDNVLQGRQRGRIFVDASDAPTAALMCRTYDYYLAGDPGAGALRQFIKDAPAEPGAFQHLYGFCLIGERWQAALLADRPAFAVIPRLNFKWEGGDVIDWRARLPDGARVVPIDRALAARIDRELVPLIAIFWESHDLFITGGFGFCLLLGDAIASVAYAATVSATQANISVETVRPFQRRGLATLVCSAFIESCLKRGLQPTWDTDAVNAGSIALARKLGFVEHKPFTELGMPARAPLPLSSGIWSSAPASDGGVVWTRPGDGRGRARELQECPAATPRTLTLPDKKGKL